MVTDKSKCNKMKDIPADSLIKNYLPADYMDSYSCVITSKQAIAP